MLRKLIILFGALLLLSIPLRAQTEFDDASRAGYICDVIRYITWPNENSIDTFRLAILSKDDALVKELKKTLSGRLIHDKPAKVVWFREISEVKPVQAIFLKKEYGFDIDVLLYAIKGENTLVISENFEFHKSMINFIVVNNKKRFEMNSELMKDEGFSVTLTFAELAVKKEADWKELFKEVNQELQLEKHIVEEQKALIQKQNKEIEGQTTRILQLNEDISRRQRKIDQQNQELDRQTLELDHLINEALFQEKLIAEKVRVLDSQKVQIDISDREIAKQQKVLKAQIGEISEQKGMISTQNTLIKEQNAKLLAQAIALGLFVFLIIACAGLIFFIYRSYRIKKESNRVLQEKNEEIMKQKDVIEREKERSESLLLNILPHKVANDLKLRGRTEPQFFRNVTVFFSDIVGFTSQSSKFEPQFVIGELNDIFTAFDNIIEKYACERIKTIGDAYLAVCGMPEANPDHAEKILQSAIEIVEYLKQRNAEREVKWEIRIGLHSGDVVGGVVGVKKYIYDVFGDTINTASRMESNSEPMQINISESTYNLLKGRFSFVEREVSEIKGKGKMRMFFYQEAY